MSKKKRLCWNCEGGIEPKATHCTYCGAEQTGAQSETVAAFQMPKTGEPYSAAVAETPTEQIRLEGARGLFVPLLLLLPGTMFLMFGLVLLLFSHDGFLTLRWDASYWYVYALISLPLVYLGWRAVDGKATQ